MGYIPHYRSTLPISFSNGTLTVVENMAGLNKKQTYFLKDERLIKVRIYKNARI